MNKKLTSFVALIIMLAASVTASADDAFCDFKPYIGVDAQLRRMVSPRGYGNPPFNHNYAQGNLFAGVQFNRYLGIEVGYEASRTKHKSQSLHAEDFIFGNNLNSYSIFPGVAVSAKSKISGWNLNITGAIPLYEDCLDLIGSIGFAQLKPKVDLAFTELFGLSASQLAGLNTIIDQGYVRFPRKNKTVPRVMLGLQYMFHCNIGFRLTVGWEQTSKLNLRLGTNFLPEQPPVVFTARFKNSIMPGVGLFWRF